MTQHSDIETPPHKGERALAGEPRLPWIGLIALAAAIFISQTAEFIPGGLLSAMAAEFGRSYAAVGQLITVFAVAVVVTTTPLAMLLRRIDRKLIAITAFSIILIATGCASIAPTFELLILARVVGGAAHGLFWAVAAAYAAELVPASQLGRATAITAAGGTLSGLLGIPIGNALGQLLGWRSAFLMITVTGVLVLVIIVIWLPRVPANRAVPSQQRAFRPPAIGRVLLVCCAILAIVLGQLIFATYSVPWLTDVGGLPVAAIPAYLLGTGVVGGIGVALAGRAADRAPRRAFALLGGVVVVTLGFLPLASNSSVVVVVVLGLGSALAFAGIPLMLQAKMMRVAPSETRSLAAALQTTSFNIAIGGGAAAGGIALNQVGLAALPSVAAVITGAAIATVVIYEAVRYRQKAAAISEAGSTREE